MTFEDFKKFIAEDRKRVFIVQNGGRAFERSVLKKGTGLNALEAKGSKKNV